MKLITDWPAFWRGFAQGVGVSYLAAALVIGIVWVIHAIITGGH